MFWKEVTYSLDKLKNFMNFVNVNGPETKLQIVYGRAYFHKHDFTCREYKCWFMKCLNEKINRNEPKRYDRKGSRSRLLKRKLLTRKSIEKKHPVETYTEKTCDNCLKLIFQDNKICNYNVCDRCVDIVTERGYICKN